MGLYEKISILGPGAKFDTCGPKDFGQTTDIPGVYHANLGGNRTCRLFKVLQSNRCKNNCTYCAFRRDRDCQRTSASSEEMAKAFDSAHKRRLVDGLFLSSGVISSPDQTMTEMINTTTILRKKYDYQGYIHLKIMPGTSSDVIKESFNLSSRLSLNIESPNESTLKEISPGKDLKKGFFYTLSLIKSEINKRIYLRQRAPSLTTQFVVGAGEETDKDIIKTTHLLYKSFSLTRVFYSAFSPIQKTPLENKEPTSLAREHRLYQADFLMRFYRFSPWDIPLDDGGFLSELKDPKTLWAEKNPQFFPINLNKASYFDLLKIPGLGPLSAEKIIKLRKQQKIKSFSQLEGKRFQIKRLNQFAFI